VINQLLYRPKQIRAGEYAVGKIGLVRVKNIRTTTQEKLTTEDSQSSKNLQFVTVIKHTAVYSKLEIEDKVK
jgi:hypothetical protein